MHYESRVTLPSGQYEGVSYTIRLMSPARRSALLEGLRTMLECAAGGKAGVEVVEGIGGALRAIEGERLLMRWGLEAVHGLEVDGQTATPGLLEERGPDGLCREILDAIEKHSLSGGGSAGREGVGAK